MKTCAICGVALSSLRAKYCGPTCKREAQPRCAEPGCHRPRLARGLCASHYNRTYHPARHPRELVTCAQADCGIVVEKRTDSRRPRRFCSDLCRDLDTASQWSCPVPERHASRATSCPVPAPHPSRVLARVLACAWCETEFVAHRRVDRFCTPRCKTKAMKARRRARESDGHVYSWTQVMRVFALLDHRCAYCGERPAGPPDPDHVIPLSRGGSNGNNNILPTCRPCNSDKRDLLLHEWAVDRARRGKRPVRTVLDRCLPAFAHLLPDAITSGHHGQPGCAA